MDLEMMGVADVKGKLEEAAQETADTLPGGGWNPIPYLSRDAFRNTPEGQEWAHDPKYGEIYVTGRWLASVTAAREQNRSRFQSLLQSAIVAVEAGLPCSELLVGHLLDSWGWPGDRPMPETAAECVAITRDLIRVPEQLDVAGYAAELREARRGM